MNTHFAEIPTPPLPSPHSGGVLEKYLQDPAVPVRPVTVELVGWLSHHRIATAVITVLMVVGVLVVRVCWLRRRQTRLHTGARFVEILTPPTLDVASAEALWANLVGLLRPARDRWLRGQPHVSFEYVFGHDALHVRMWIPGVIPPGMVERAIEAAWPGARTTTTVTDHSKIVEDKQLLTVGGELRLARIEALPLRTEFDADPLRALIGAPLDLLPGENVTVQVLARPVTGRRVTRARRNARSLHGSLSGVLPTVLDVLTPSRSPGPSPRAGGNADRVTTLEHAAQDRAVMTKLRGPLFATTVRYVATTDASEDRDRLRGRAHAVASAFATFTGHNHYRRRRITHPQRVIDKRQLERGDLLSIPELAVVAHLPTDLTVPGLHRAGARALPPPPAIPTAGPHIKPLGVADTGRARPVGVSVADARHHLHLLGATGSGKSTLMAQLILADASAGRGAVVIDPKGDLVTDLLDRLGSGAGDRLLLLDADSPVRPPCLNPLDTARGDDVAVDNLTSVFARVYAAFWGPRTDDILRAACLTLRAQPAVATLADLPPLLTEPAYRQRALRAVKDPVLQGFWTWYDQLSDAGRAQAIAPLMNKLRAFLLRPFVRDALAAGPSTLDMTKVLDGGILLVRIPKGSLGEDTTKLIGSLVVASVWQAATARAAQAQDDRRDAGLYVDECQNFLNLPYPLEDMLAEARGFRLSMTLAHQHLGQLGREMKDGVSTNARNKVYFTSSPQDARDLARHTAPRLTDHDLSHLGAFHAAARLVTRGEDAPAFTLSTTDLPPPIPGRAKYLRRAAVHALDQPPSRFDVSADIPDQVDPRRVA